FGSRQRAVVAAQRLIHAVDTRAEVVQGPLELLALVARAAQAGDNERGASQRCVGVAHARRDRVEKALDFLDLRARGLQVALPGTQGLEQGAGLCDALLDIAERSLGLGDRLRDRFLVQLGNLVVQV